MAAGYNSAAALATAGPEELHAALLAVNTGHRFYKGTLGLRAVKRLVRAAGDVPG